MTHFKKLYIVRHGQTDYNLNRIVQGAGIDSELNDLGRLQADALYKSFKSKNIDRIYVSDLKRAKQTIEPFEKQSEIPIYVDSRLREINWGVHEGMRYNTELSQDYKRVLNAWSDGNLNERLEKAESAQELFNRLESFLADLQDSKDQNILLCTHGRTIRALMTILTNSHPSKMKDFSHQNCGIYELEWDGTYAKIIAKNINDHLINVQS